MGDSPLGRAACREDPVSILSNVLERYNGIVARGRNSGPTVRDVSADPLARSAPGA